MSKLAFLFLVVTAWFIQTAQKLVFDQRTTTIFGAIFLLLWLPFLFEAIWLRFFTTNNRGENAGFLRLLLPIIIPPLRLTRRANNNSIWIPNIGWQRVDQELRNHLENKFNLPMLFFALLIIPVLGVEYYYKGAIPEQHSLNLIVDFTTAIIWLAFTIEFLIMASLAEKWYLYVKSHWLELVIILLPFIAFLRSLRLFQVARVAQVGRSLRLKGIATRAFRALLLLNIIQRLLKGGPEKQLERLKEQYLQKEIELKELKQQIKTLQNSLEDKKS
ncbi:MAG: hypothetical protein HQL70_09265 [Magnetococcales bacterium]|nr:hypothetical protein [Magnetococcales bacterium]